MTLWIPHPFPETQQPWEPPPVSSSRVLNHVYLQMFTGAVTAEGPFQAVTLILLEERCTKIISSCQTFRTMKQKQMWHYNPWVLNPTTVPFFFFVSLITFASALPEINMWQTSVFSEVDVLSEQGPPLMSKTSERRARSNPIVCLLPMIKVGLHASNNTQSFQHEWRIKDTVHSQM